MPDHHVFMVADGMGGHNAGEIASQLTADVMSDCFTYKNFPGESRPEWPRRGDELVRAIHHANLKVFERARKSLSTLAWGTTVVAVRFSPNKQRAYIAHVGDSRCYRIRSGELHQLTEDHTLGRLMGAKGKGRQAPRPGRWAFATTWPSTSTVDEPQPGDLYLGLLRRFDEDGLRRCDSGARPLGWRLGGTCSRVDRQGERAGRPGQHHGHHHPGR